QLDGFISDEAIELLKMGVEIGIRNVKYQTKPCVVKRLNEPPDFPPRTKKIRDDRHGPTSWISVTLKEGKERQVRKMTAKTGFPTLRLVRVRVGNFKLEGLPAGAIREIGDLMEQA
ncbi:MAG TPA: pseudouridine synthase, partial [Chitinophagales bacterium]|nr:pseudouridine synthase [Chitinophagales bacterium]